MPIGEIQINDWINAETVRRLGTTRVSAVWRPEAGLEAFLTKLDPNGVFHGPGALWNMLWDVEEECLVWYPPPMFDRRELVTPGSTIQITWKDPTKPPPLVVKGGITKEAALQALRSVHNYNETEPERLLREAFGITRREVR